MALVLTDTWVLGAAIRGTGGEHWGAPASHSHGPSASPLHSRQNLLNCIPALHLAFIPQDHKLKIKREIKHSLLPQL